MVFNYKNISLLAYDFDGVMTNNKVLLNEDGKESVIVNRADGLAIDMLKKLMIPQIIISTETNKLVKKRAEKLGISVFCGIDNKLKVLKKICKDHHLSIKKVLYVGNDLNDMEIMKAVGYAVAPSDAHPEIRKIAKIIIKKKGGEGVIRGLADILLGIKL